jgi:hypothetical protein
MPKWRLVFIAAAMAMTAPIFATADDATRPVDFNRDVRPILSDVCFKCHGPDAAQRKADLRLDTEEGAKADLGDGRRAVIAGDANASELYRRIASKDPDQVMPPPDAEQKLSPAQIATLKKWVDQGARWQKHWSFLKPVKAALPAVKNQKWVRTPLDAFILARLESEGLSPSAEADPTTLLRRVTLDLTGLPPSPDEVEKFLVDPSPDAYERAVDRLLASPRFGERMAVRWMDGARYADTSGYQSDGERIMWRWRDWVIDAYNENLPFDRFTIDQIAGDLVPNATLDQRIATGFNRNHRGNAEGGIIPEEYAVEYVVDRVETTATVWLGLTAMCARCHSHKFDPITQADFYRLYAYFNNIPEKGRAVKYGNSPPFILAPTRDQQREIERLSGQIAEADSAWKAMQPELAGAVREWEKSVVGKGSEDWSTTRGLTAHLPLDGSPKPKFTVPATHGKPAGYLGQVREPEETTEAVAKKYTEVGKPKYVAGRIGKALLCDDTHYAGAGDVGHFGFFDRFAFSFWIKPQGDKGGTILSRMVDTFHGSGWCVVLDKGRVQLHLSQRYLDDACRAEADATLAPDQWHHVVVSYDGSRESGGIRFHINGESAKSISLLDELNQTFAQKEPLRIGAGNGPEGRFHGLIDDVRVFDRVVSDSDALILATPETVSAIAALPTDKRSPAQQAKLERYFVETAAPEAIRTAWTRRLALEEERDRFVDTLPTTMVMQELPESRPAHILIRGEYDKRGEQVDAGVPGSLPSLPEGVSNNRLGLARWLVDANNPLTARVAVNRIWQQLFGTGLVKTVDDFGVQGEWPSHPDLLDWLAVEFQQTWDTKRLIRLIVTSASYRQSSKATPEIVQRDPENRLLARGPRFRLSAEMVRDQALAASGLLVERLGGPSVKPYQPEGLWKDLAGLDYEADHGDALYRRSLYTYWKRTIAPPAMMTFDAAGRETCIVKESRTNTPLQALNLMNDVTYVEASRFIAERMLKDGGTTPADRIRHGFLLALGRAPQAEESKVLAASYERHLAHYKSNPTAADALTKIGERPRTATLNVQELATCTAVAGLILNLDEAIMRE